MPIQRRTIAADAELQTPAKIVKQFVPNDKAIIPSQPSAAHKREAGFLFYSSEPPGNVPFDDIVALARTVANEGENLETAYRNRIKGRLSAIRAFCVMDLGSAKRVRSCENVTCPLWAFRMGSNPFRRRK